MSTRRIVVVGGGAAGVFAAIACAEAHRLRGYGHRERRSAAFQGPHLRRRPLQRHPRLLRRARARRALSARRAGAARAVQRFQAARHRRVVRGARRASSRPSPTGACSRSATPPQTIIDCLLRRGQAAGVKLGPNCGVEARRPAPGRRIRADARATARRLSAIGLLLATGGCRAPAAGTAGGRRSATPSNRRCRRCSRFTSRRRGCASWQGFRSRRWKSSVPAAGCASAGRCW